MSKQETVQGKCEEYPNLFNSPYLDEFDEEEFRESQHDIKDDEFNEMLAVAKSLHEIRAPRVIESAKNICASCPLVQTSCRKYALRAKPEAVFGVLAGMTVEERKEAQKAEKRARTKQLQAQKSAVSKDVTISTPREDLRRITEALMK